MRCPDCKSKLLKIAIQDPKDSSIKDIWIHPLTSLKCEYKSDGIEIHVKDKILMEAFQRLILESGIEEVSKPETKVSGEEKATKHLDETNEDRIKRRLTEGVLSINEFDEIAKRIK